MRLSLGAVHDAMGEDAIIEGSGLSRLKVASEELADQHKKNILQFAKFVAIHSLIICLRIFSSKSILVDGALTKTSTFFTLF